MSYTEEQLSDNPSLRKPQSYDLVRLTPEVYLDLEKKFAKPIATDNTSPIQAGYQLGVQAILQALRSGYVLS